MKNKLITNPFISHLELHLSCFGKVKSISSLRDLLSRFLNIGDTFSFRNSTTNAFIDVLQILLEDTTYRVIYTNLENPSILNAIENFVPKNRRVQLDLMKLLLEGKFDEIEKTIAKSYGKKCIYLFSHVLWNCGVSLNIEKISSRIKSNNQENLIIVDGAQAIGNVANIFSKNFDKDLIDFYLGCTHKWLNTKNLLGFVYISSSFNNTYRNITDKIFIQDLFSVFAGKYDGSKTEHQMSSYDFNLLYQITKELNMNIENFKFAKSKITQNFNFSEAYLIPNIYERTHNFFGVYGDRDNLNKLCDIFELSKYLIVDDKYLPHNYSWLRIV